MHRYTIQFKKKNMWSVSFFVMGQKNANSEMSTFAFHEKFQNPIGKFKENERIY